MLAWGANQTHLAIKNSPGAEVTRPNQMLFPVLGKLRRWGNLCIAQDYAPQMFYGALGIELGG